MLITANRLQMGKTKASIRIGEKVMEVVEGRKWTPDLLGFDNLWFFDQWKKVPQWTPLDLDEPQRPAGNRNWHSEENQALAEWVQTRAYEHRPCLFPLPHQHLFDNAVVGVCTSHLIIDRPLHGLLYEYQRDQLNRTYKTRTRYIGEISFGEPYAWDWKAYMEKRITYTEERGRKLEEKVKLIHSQADNPASPLSYDEVVAIVTANQAEYTEKGRLSPSAVQVKLKVPYNKAQKACKEVMYTERQREKAESAS